LDALDAHLAREDARTDARFHALRGECLRRVGERAAAAEALARARGMSPDDPETAYFEAQLARDAGERELALAALRRACDASAAREGRLLRAQLELARWLLQDGRLDEARARHARYLELGGEEPLEAR
jgi:tetratricopeptide (TPR) repeat protein